MSQQQNIKVRKANGDLVYFDERKLIDALLRAGAGNNEARKVARQVLLNIQEGTKTSKIYRLAYQLIKKESKAVAGRYRLKKAVYDLGPSGYPFEKFIGRLMEYKGYRVQLNSVERGCCVKHELDVVAENNKEKIMIECKFHRDKGHKNDVKIPLYIQSRFLDIKAAWQKEEPQKQYVGMLATNTRFSQDAIDYSHCMGLRLLSWDYPRGESLRNWIDEAGFHPITALNSLNGKAKESLMQQGLVLCRDLLAKPEALDGLLLSNTVKKEALREAHIIVHD